MIPAPDSGDGEGLGRASPIRLDDPIFNARPNICGFFRSHDEELRATHMEWALEERPGVGDLLKYEARANYLWINQEGPFNPVICAYDLTKFRADVSVDVSRTHPLAIVGGILLENPFFVPPEQFVRELHERRSVAIK